MYFYDVREIAPKEYHVIETRYVREPEFVLAKCSGPVPAWNIVHAMRISQSLIRNKDGIHNAIFGIRSSLEVFDLEMKKAVEDNSKIGPVK